MTVGLIGYGRFGKLAARLLARYTRVVVYDRVRRPGERLPGQVRWGRLDEAASQPFVVLAVPVSRLKPVLDEIQRMVRPGALIADVCSAKVQPARWMRSSMPAGVDLLGTHPFFGPDTVRRSLRGRTIVLCPVRITPGRLSRIARLLRQTGLVIRVASPEEHDRLVSRTVLLTQYIGRLIRLSGLPAEEMVTGPYASLLELAGVAARDDAGVFTDMWRYNSHSRELSRALRRGQRRVDHLLRQARGLHKS